MNSIVWTKILFYGNLLLVTLIFIFNIRPKDFRKVLPVGLFIGIENYTAEILGLYYDIWKYPLKSIGYPEVTILSSLLYFPMIAMLFYKFLSSNTFKNIFLIILFATYNIIIEIITLKTTHLFVYGKSMKLWIASLMYIGAYILIIIFKWFYTKNEKGVLS